MYRLFLTKTADKQLEKLSEKTRVKIMAHILQLKQWKGHIIKMNTGIDNYRLRIGNYRVVFSLKDDTIYIVDINDRKDIYKGR